MKCFRYTAIAAFLLWSGGDLFAHGGSTLPPAGGPPGPSTKPDPFAPPTGASPGKAPGGSPSGPTTGSKPNGGGNAPGPGPNTGATGGGARGSIVTAGFIVGNDLSTWETWWDLNRHGLLDLRRAVRDAGVVTGESSGRDLYRPSERDLRERVLPSMLRVLSLEKNPDLVTGLLIAMGKIGLDARLSSEMVPFLSAPNQEIAETAAFSLGLLRSERALPALLALARDEAQGRAFVGKSSVPVRTRAFAIYGLGVFGMNSEDESTRGRIVDALRAMGDSDSVDVQAARVVALGLVLDERRSAAEPLRRLLEDRKTDPRVRAQIPIALARLLSARSGDARHPMLPLARASVMTIAEERSEHEWIRSSCIQALAHLVVPGEEGYSKVVEALARIVREGRTPTEKQFATIALGRLGGPEAEASLRRLLVKSSTLRPWAALALGILGGRDASVRAEISKTLQQALDDEKNPSQLGAIAIAIGILRDPSNGDFLLDEMKRLRNDEAKGYFALALGMIGAQQAVPEIQKLVHSSLRKPDLQQQAVMGLGLLGDKSAAVDLAKLLGEAKTLSTQSTLATALGWIGDRRSIDPLLELLEGVRMTPLGRGFVAAALGMVGDQGSEHWSSRIATDVNYFAAPPTLVDRANLTGILDIL